MTIETVTIERILPTAVWIEDDICGSRHVMLQHEGMNAFCYASFHYDYAYTSNAGTWAAAVELAKALGATDPVERRQRPGWPAPAGVPLPAVPHLPEGFRLLPVEATDAMMDADWNVTMSEAHSNGGVAAAAWRAMVEAAPEVTYGNGHSGIGWYMHDTEYPEEGAVLMSEPPALGVMASRAPEQYEAVGTFMEDGGRWLKMDAIYANDPDAVTLYRRTDGEALGAPADGWNEEQRDAIKRIEEDPQGAVEEFLGVPRTAPGVADVAPTEQQAHDLGAKGAPATERERLLFEAWMRGHCWALSATWNGKQYVSDAEQGGDLDPRAMATRRLFAAWRDRAALGVNGTVK